MVTIANDSSRNPAAPGAVILVRCPAVQAGAVIARVATAHAVSVGRGVYVFFQGPGVSHGIDSDAVARWDGLARRISGTRLVVCESAWRRRADSPPATGWNLGSLVEFWDQAMACAALDSFGVGW